MQKSDDVIQLIIQATALSQHTDTMFTKLIQTKNATQIERMPLFVNQLAQLLMLLLNGGPQLQQRLLIEMINHGNFLDIECELDRQLERGLTSAPYQIWQEIANQILQIQDSQTFHAKRIYIMQMPFQQQGNESREQAIVNVKNAINVPSQCSWDTISYKISPSASEYWCMQDQTIFSKLQQSDLAIIDQIENAMKNKLVGVFQEYKQDVMSDDKTDQFIDDLSILLEMKIAGVDEDLRRKKITNMGDEELMQYVALSAQAFTQGIIPGSINPAKITACQDSISMLELQQSIQELAEEQVSQAGLTQKNPAVRAGIKQLGQEQRLNKWTQQQNTSISHAASITQELMHAGMTMFGENPYEPQKELGNQITGGANTLMEQVNLAKQGQVVRLTPYEQEVLKQSLSLLLACIRIRFNATRDTRGELVSQSDIDHMYIIQRLAMYTDAQSMQFFNEATQVLIEEVSNGHNKIRLLGKGPTQKAVEAAVAQAQTIAEEMAKAIPVLEADLTDAGDKSLFYSMLAAVYTAMTDKDRINRERILRYIKRRAVFDAVQSYTY